MYDISHRSYIWKNLYECMQIPAPILPPTFSFHDKEHEYEHMVTRAVSLDDNWRRLTPKIYQVRPLQMTYQIHEAHMVKGGRFMIAAMSDSFRSFLA